MSLSKIIARLQNRYRRNVSNFCNRRMVPLRPAQPIVSFTFDDFPRSALHNGGTILKRYGLLGTYYVSLGLMDRDIPAGRAFSKEDLIQTIADGHELGCHTFAHCHSWDTASADFEKSIVENERALATIAPGAQFKSLSYPIAWPRPQTKRRAARHFPCCRGGGPSFNLGLTDANNLQASFIEKHRDHPDTMMRLIEENGRAGGWLIFATHDVTSNPTSFGCTPELFEAVVRAVQKSGARVLPVGAAWRDAQAAA
jgi:peptidoglycan/xylan/chitin deacetylase (PgdA/CDA1 family)